ncbi:transposase, partial [Thiolapillus sp.]
FKKRHDYVTIVSDQEAGTVLFVGEDRKKATLKAWYESLTGRVDQGILPLGLSQNRT